MKDIERRTGRFERTGARCCGAMASGAPQDAMADGIRIASQRAGAQRRPEEGASGAWPGQGTRYLLDHLVGVMLTRRSLAAADVRLIDLVASGCLHGGGSVTERVGQIAGLSGSSADFASQVTHENWGKDCGQVPVMKTKSLI